MLRALRSKRLLLELIVAVVMCALSSGCDVGGKARDTALWPTIDTAWPNVKYDAQHGGAEAETLTAYEIAIETRDAQTVVLDWPPIKSAALTGIINQQQAGEIAIGVGDSKRERVSNFDAAVRAASRDPQLE